MQSYQTPRIKKLNSINNNYKSPVSAGNKWPIVYNGFLKRANFSKHKAGHFL